MLKKVLCVIAPKTLKLFFTGNVASPNVIVQTETDIVHPRLANNSRRGYNHQARYFHNIIFFTINKHILNLDRLLGYY